MGYWPSGSALHTKGVGFERRWHLNEKAVFSGIMGSL